jgi:threonine synthase
MLSAIGNTPLVRLSRIVPPGAADVWVKREYYNPAGSYKDRMALSMVERAEERGDLKPGMSAKQARNRVRVQPPLWVVRHQALTTPGHILTIKM